MSTGEIDNTTARMRDPAEKLLFLAKATGSPGSPIERMERDGQRQLVNSSQLPSDFRGERAGWEALGFAFGEPGRDDPLFMPATLPEGWQREGSDHAMWSYLLDTAGRRRVGIFYKAAFYDRSAFMRLESLDWYVTQHVEYGGPLVITGEWATAGTVAAALERLRDHEVGEAAKCREYAAETGRTEDNRARLREIATEHDEKAARYAAKLQELGGAA